MTALVVGLAVAVALLAVLVAGLLRGHAEVLRALHRMGVDLGPGTGEPPEAGGVDGVPTALARSGRARGSRPTPGRPDPADVADLVGTSPSGDALGIAVRGVSHDTLLVFLTSGCASCRSIWDSLRKSVPEAPGGARQRGHRLGLLGPRSGGAAGAS